MKEQQSEVQEDRAFRNHMGEKECPHCGVWISDEEDYTVCEGSMFCKSCGGELI